MPTERPAGHSLRLIALLEVLGEKSNLVLAGLPLGHSSAPAGSSRSSMTTTSQPTRIVSCPTPGLGQPLSLRRRSSSSRTIARLIFDGRPGPTLSATTRASRPVPDAPLGNCITWESEHGIRRINEKLIVRAVNRAAFLPSCAADRRV